MSQNEVVNAFLNPAFYDHPVDTVELVETHISWVFLTGQFAYKIKKPVDFGFLNFTDLEKRKYYCQQELLLNSRFAAEIYLDVIPVTKSKNKIYLGMHGEVIEYAIKMKQFDQQYLLNRLLKKQQITLSHIHQLSQVVADFHKSINSAPLSSDHGLASEVIKPVVHNFEILREILTDANDLNKLQILEEKTLSIYKNILGHLGTRKTDGFIRECHGDLHLGNIAFIEDRLLLFDGIEFNESFRWIDTMSEIAFLIMDLQDHDEYLLASYFLNEYLSITGDYAGLRLLKFYQIYRATVRAKVTGLRLQQHASDKLEYENNLRELRKYLELAATYTGKNKLFIAISFGLSGSGKSHVCSEIARYSGAIQIRSDVERKRLLTSSDDDLYTRAATESTYTHLLDLCRMILSAEFPVIVDATFLKQEHRLRFLNLAQAYNIPFRIFNCQADINTIRNRLINREKENLDASDANVKIMEAQLTSMDPLSEIEKTYEITIDTTRPFDAALVTSNLDKKKQ